MMGRFGAYVCKLSAKIECSIYGPMLCASEKKDYATAMAYKEYNKFNKICWHPMPFRIESH